MIKFYSSIATIKKAIYQLTAALQTFLSAPRKRSPYVLSPIAIHSKSKPEFSNSNKSQMQTFTNTTKSPGRFNRSLMTLIIAVIALMVSSSTKAQIAVTVTGSGNTTPALQTSYTSLAAALTDVNLVTAMSGPVTLTCSAGASETAPATGLSIGSATLNSVLSSVNTITVVKAAGAATVLNAGTGTATPASAVLDGILRLDGADYVTIDGLTFTDGNSASATVAMEFGVGLFKKTAGDGCNNNTIQNCTFNMQRINNSAGTAPVFDGAVAILVINSTSAAATTALTPTNGGTLSTNGTNSGNKFYGNTINGGNIGIGLSGFAATAGVGPTPTATTFLGDLGNDIGGAGALAATTGNTILNFGGGAATNPAAGIRANNQWSLNISNNTVNNNNGTGVNHATTLRGIYGQAGTSANVTISYNTVTLKSAATTSSVSAIENAIGATAASNTVTITNNIIQNSTYTTATTGTFSGILAAASATTQTINSNQVLNNAIGTSGVGSSCIFQGIYSSATNATTNMNSNTVSGNQVLNSFGTLYGLRNSTATLNIDGNTVTTNGFPNSAGATSSTLYGIFDGSSPVIENYTNNNINNLTINGTSTATGHVIYGIYMNTAAGAKTVSGNNINTLTFTSSSTGASTVAGIRDAYSTTANIFNNTIHTLSATGVTPTVAGLYLGSTTITTINAYNNLIANLSTPASTGHNLYGIFCGSAGTALNLYYNTVYLNGSSTGTGFASSAVFMSSTTPTVTLQNNILVNLSTPTGTGITAALRRTSATVTAYGSTSNNNLFYAGTPSTVRLLYYDATNLDQTMATFKTRVSPRESSSFSETVSSTPGVFFQSLTGPSTGTSSTFLHMVGGLTTQVESGGVPVSGITTDYDGNTRNASKPDVGADEFAGVSPAPSFANVSVPAPSCTAVSHTISADVTTATGTITTVTLNYNNGSVGSATMVLQSGSTYQASIPAASPTNTTVTWSITATNSNGLSTIFSGTSYQDDPLLGVVSSATASVSAICVGGSTNLTASLVKAGGVATIGSGASTSSSLGTSMFPGSWGGAKTQFLIRKSELNAQGLAAGNITALAFTPTSGGQAYPGFAVSMAHTATTDGAMTAGLVATTDVYAPGTSFTPTLGVANTITFTTPFNWNGVNDIIVSICWSTALTTSTSTTVQTDALAFNCTYGWQNDSQTPAVICGTLGAPSTGNTPVLSANRPKFSFTGVKAFPITSVTWNNGGGTGNPVTVSPASSTSYTGVITASGCTVSTNAVSVTVNPLPTAPNAGTASVQCGTAIPTVAVSDPNGFTTPVFKWYADNSTTTALQSSTSTTYTTAITSTTNFFVSVVNPVTGCESNRTQVTANVNTPDPITATTSSPTVCQNGSITLNYTQTGTTNTYNQFSWVANPPATAGIASPTSASTSASPTTTVNYTYTLTATETSTGCIATSQVSVGVNPNPVIGTVTGTPNPVCSGNTVNLTATSVGVVAGTASIGAGATTSSASGVSMFSGSWGGIKTQYIIKASELTAANVKPGAITSLAFQTSGAAGQQYTGFAMSIGHTTQTAMSIPLIGTGLTQVYAGTEGANNGFTPATSAVNTLVFGTGGTASSFVWNGTDNIVISFCFSTVSGATTSSATTILADDPGFTCSAYGKKDATLPSAFCPLLTSTDFGTSSTATSRPKFIIGGQVIGNNAADYTWTWTTTLPVGTVANGASTSHVPTTTSIVTGTYTATALSSLGCTASATTSTFTVNPLPAVPTSLLPSTQCGPGVPTAQVGNGSNGNYRWYLTPTGGTALAGEVNDVLTAYSISLPTTFYVSSVDNITGCEGGRVSILADVISPDQITAVSNGPVCFNSAVNLSITQTGSNQNYTFTWTATSPNNATSGISGSVPGAPVTGAASVTPTATGSYTYHVAANDGPCNAVADIVVIINPNPVIDSITALPATVCEGSSSVLNVYAAGIGAGPQTQPSGYCTATFSNTTREDNIGQVTFAGINNPAVRSTPQASNPNATALYTDYTGIAAGIVTAGTTYPFTLYQIHGTTDQSANFANVYIDFNRNGVFTDAGETFTLSKPGATFYEDFVGNIAIPATAKGGITRMRVVIREGAITTPCGTVGTWGEAEDYLLNVTGVIPQSTTLNYLWDNGAGTSSTATVTPAAGTSNYTAVVTNPSTSCFTTSPIVSVTVNALPTAPVATPSQQCGTGIPTASVAAGGGGNGVFHWYLVPTGGTALAGENGTSLQNYTISTPTSFYVSESSANGCESPRTQVDVTFDLTPDELTLTPSAATICLGNSFTFTVGQTGGANSYIFNYPSLSHVAGSGINIPNVDGVDSSLLDGNITVTPTAAGTYTYTIKGFDPDKGCIAFATTTVTVQALPSITSFTVTPSPVCEGATLTLTAKSVAGGTGTAAVGTATTLSGNTDLNTAFNNRWPSARTQLLYTATELQAAGLLAGNITSIAFNINTLGDAATNANYRVKIGNTGLSVLTAFVDTTTGFTNVYNPKTYTHTATGLQTITFDAPFVWDGTSNIIVQVVMSGADITNNAQTYYTATTTNQAAYTSTASTNAATLSLNRLNIVFGGFVGNNLTGNYTWEFNPGAISGGTTGVATTTASAGVTSYTATATSALGCAKTSDPVNITVNPVPVAPTATPSTQCGNGVPTASVSGAGGTYKWYSAATGGTVLQTGGTTYTSIISAPTHFWVSETSAAGCEGPRADVFADVTTPPNVVITPAGPTTFCAGGSVGLTASGTGYTDFSWSPAAGLDATNVATVTATPSVTTTYIVTASGAGCSSTGTITVTSNPNPSIDSISALPATICAGGNATLTAFTKVPTTFNIGEVSETGFGSLSGYGMYFKTTTATTINTVDIYPSTAGTLTVQLRNGTTVVDSRTFTIVAGDISTTVVKTLTLNFNVPAGVSGWNIYYPDLAINRGQLSYNYPYVSNGFTISGNTLDGDNLTSGGTRFYFYNWNVTAISYGAGSYNWQWNPGAIAANIASVTPASTTAYSVTATDPVTSCTTTSVSKTVTVQAVGANATSTLAALCAGGSTTLAANATGGGPFTYLWDDAAASTTATITVSPTVTTTYQVTVKDACNNPVTSQVTVTVNPLPTVSVNEPGATICSPATYSITSTTNAASPSYQWIKVPTGPISGAVASGYTASSTGFYTVRVTDGVTGCINTAGVSAAVTVNPSPSTVTVSPDIAICNGGSTVLTASGGSTGGSGTASIGTATTLSGNTDVNTAFNNRWPSARIQLLYTAAELQTAGISAGSLTSAAFNISTLGDAATNANYRIKIGNTGLSALTGFVDTTSGFTDVYTPKTYTHTASGLQTIPFDAPFNWDGSSNIIIQVAMSGADITNNAQTFYTATTTNQAAYTLTASTNAATLSLNRLNIVFGYNSVSAPVWSWTPTTGLTPSNAATVTAAPTANTTYTVKATNGFGCFSSANVTVTVNPVTVITVDAAPATQLVGQNTTATPLTVTATGTGTVTYQWFSNTSNSNSGGTPAGTGASFAPPTTTVGTLYYYAVATGDCGTATSSAVRVDVVNANTNFWTAGAATTNWSTAANWSLNSVPTTLNDIVIPTSPAGGAIFPVLTAAANAKNVLINANATISLGGNTLTLSGGVSGTGRFIGSATSSLVIGGASTLNFNSGTAATIKNLTINAGTTTLGTALDITGGAGSINTSGTVTVAPSATLASGGFLTFKSNQFGTARLASGNVTGDVTVERYIPGNAQRAWRMLSVPTKGLQKIKQAWQESGNANNFNPKPGFGTEITSNVGPYATMLANGFDELTAKASMQRWNSAGGSWLDITATQGAGSIGNIESIKGYAIYVRGDRTQLASGAVTSTTPTTLRTTGTLYIGDQAAIPVAASKFDLIGNTYVSPIDFLGLTRTNMVNTFYLWDPKLVVGTAPNQSLGGYVTFSLTNGFVGVPNSSSYGITPRTTIQSGEAFMVQANAGGGSIQLKETAKVAGDGLNYFRPAAGFEKLKANLYTVASDNTATMADANVSVFNDAFSNSVDGDDAVKLTNAGENFSIYRENKNLVIEGRQAIADYDTTYFNMWNMQQGKQYRMELITEQMDIPGLTGYLVDNYLGTSTALNMTGTMNYDFTITTANAASSAIDRFKVVYRQVQAGPLPVSFISIGANKVGAAVKVEWKVSAERGIKRYEVERSADGSKFATAGSVTATGNSSTDLSYAWMDVTPLTGTNFYRIKSVGVAGEVKYTNIVKVSIGDVKPSFTIAPNPVEGSTVNLQFKNQAAGRYSVRLLSNAGQIVFTTIAEHAGGNSTQIISLPVTIARGSYQIEIIAPDKTTREVQNLFINTIK